jgi:hypothetical protein
VKQTRSTASFNFDKISFSISLQSTPGPLRFSLLRFASYVLRPSNVDNSFCSLFQPHANSPERRAPSVGQGAKFHANKYVTVIIGIL